MDENKLYFKANLEQEEGERLWEGKQPKTDMVYRLAIFLRQIVQIRKAIPSFLNTYIYTIHTPKAIEHPSNKGGMLIDNNKA